MLLTASNISKESLRFCVESCFEPLTFFSINLPALLFIWHKENGSSVFQYLTEKIFGLVFDLLYSNITNAIKSII